MTVRIILYNIIIIAVVIVTMPWIIYQLAFVKKRRQGLAQRFGRSPVMEKETVWCHAVSVGEVRAISPMLVLLEDHEKAKGRIALSTVTVTGQETAIRECGFVRSIFYFPLDLPFLVRRAILRVSPEIFITAETEIWPNFFFACFRKNIPVVIVNGRISDSSYSRYLKFRWFFRPFLEGVSAFIMQSEEDARRVLALGARQETVTVTGNTKYDRKIADVTLPEEVARWSTSRFLFVAGSTHQGEEETVLEAVNSIDASRIRTAIVPRHPERFDTVASLLDQKGIPWERFSEVEEGRALDADFLLVDAMGVLEGFYALADAAFVGGSLVPVGGHNLLEPAMHSVPVLTGPHTHNFRDITRVLTSSGGCLVVDGVDDLARVLETLLTEPETREEMGRMAAAASEGATGASSRNAEKVVELINNLES